MKHSSRRPDPLEETIENPDLPPLTPVQLRAVRGAAATGKRGWGMPLALGALALLLVAGLRFVF